MEVLVCILATLSAVSGRFYKKERVSPSSWTLNEYKSLDYIHSLIECGSICDVDPDCGAFSFRPEEPDACQLAALEIHCEPLDDGNGGGDLVDFHLAKREEGSKAVSKLLTGAAAKTGWSAAVSSQYRATELPSYIVDGITATFWADATNAPPNTLSWVQITLPGVLWVQGLVLYTRDFAVPRMRIMHLEVRVGNEEIIGSPTDKPLCQNQFCYNTGNDDTSFSNAFDCLAPVRGSIITMQRLKYDPAADHSQMELTEVDVDVFCGPFTKSSCIDEEPLDMCRNRNELADGAYALADQADKQSWTLTASTTLDGHDIAKLVDGDQTGDLTDQKAFATKSLAGGDPLPWIQIDIGETKVVKAVHLINNDATTGSYALYTEVRVGNTDAAADAELGTRLCTNPVCKTTGGGVAQATDTSDCSGGPLEGRYVTLQRHRFAKDADGSPMETNLVLSEVEIEFYN